jgi:two-component system OmpR family response regulator
MAQKSRRILLVDDNRDATAMLVVLLRDMGHIVECAVNARAALEAARRMLPEIVFLDLVLPDMDGCELARQLKREPALTGVRIFAMTGHGDEESRRRSLEAGCDTHLLKPVDPKFLESLLGSPRH